MLTSNGSKIYTCALNISFFVNLKDHWPWPWPRRILALALASKTTRPALALASKNTGLGLEHAGLEPIPGLQRLFGRIGRE